MSPSHCLRRFGIPLLALGLGVSCSDRNRNGVEAAFGALSRQILTDHYTRHPSAATALGLHEYDMRLEDLSADAIHAESQALQAFGRQLAAIDPKGLDFD